LNHKGTKDTKGINHKGTKDTKGINHKGTKDTKGINHKDTKDTKGINHKGTKDTKGINYKGTKDTKGINYKGTKDTKVMDERANDLSKEIIGAAIAVHRELGPGLLESAYEACLEYELLDRGIAVERQVPQSVIYRGVKLDCGYRLDLLVENLVIVELKTVEQLTPIHEAQLLTYLKLRRLWLGLLINFNVPVLKQGIKRLVNN
jgi:GxxExxY protein